MHLFSMIHYRPAYERLDQSTYNYYRRLFSDDVMFDKPYAFSVVYMAVED